MDYNGKKLLVLGGAFQHSKVVEEAKRLGIYTIVTDNLAPSDAPAKQIADEYWMLNIYDVDGIVKKCKEERWTAWLPAGWTLANALMLKSAANWGSPPTVTRNRL